ncbi:DUF3899 domain-containing protein [Iocasia frigidifontis]|uniref:DUF3899 domain-containing protein n=1 Tax=Iocasia fonsfrigidae TaxID=2682810 RepID=A0A8A7KHF6_9FIRM|nr:DUF3899 domain-containing protein [Iocasia fonsfrigidae]
MIILGIITIIFSYFYIILCEHSFLYNLSNAFFITGIIYFCIALIIYIRNVGFFKIITYYQYQKKQDKINNYNKENKNSMKLHEFFALKYSEQWSYAIFLKFSIPLILISLILAFISK